MAVAFAPEESEQPPSAPQWLWVLRVQGSRLRALLSDGASRCDEQELDWPPPSGAALPEALMPLLQPVAAGAQVRLQLDPALGAWPWEHLLPVGTRVARHLISSSSAEPEAAQDLRQVTALSIDLVNSTGLLARLGAEAYAQRLQAYHQICLTCVQAHGGSLDAPQGDDGLMAYFGFPQALEAAAERALRCAAALPASLATLGVEVRMGMATGQVATAAHQAFGLDIHLAARLRSEAAPGQTLVAASTRERLRDARSLLPWADALQLRGIAQPQRVYRLELAPVSAGSGLATLSPAVFVGRSRELAQLDADWAQALEGRRCWRSLRGEAGLGKTALLREFAGRLRAQDVPCHWVQALTDTVNTPFAALRQSLGAPVIEADGAAPEREAEQLLGHLQALASRGPLVLLIDDAHWLDPSTVDLLRRLCREGAGGVLIVSAERPLVGGSLSDDVLELGSLDAAECRDLLDRLPASEQLSAAQRQGLLRRADGVPLYLEEGLRMLLQAPASAIDDAVPDSLRDLLAARLDALGPHRALAQLASVWGRDFSAAQLDALVACDDPLALRARQYGRLDTLLASGLVEAVGDGFQGYRFRHALIRDAAYRSLWLDARRRLHKRCAELLSGEQAAPERIAPHWEAASEIEAAQRAWTLAARQAATRGAHHVTLELTQRAISQLDALQIADERERCAAQLHLLQASAHIALQGYGSPAVEAAYEAAARAVRHDPAQALRIHLGLEACRVMRGDLRGAHELAERAVAQTDWQQQPRLALQARWARANVAFHVGDADAALQGFDDCLAHYDTQLHRRSGVQDPAVMCLGYSSWICFELGLADEARLRVARMLAIAQTLQHAFSSAVAHSFAASMLRLMGDPPALAWPHAEAAHSISERGGFSVWLAHAWMVRGQLRADQGDSEGGDADMAQGYARWVGSGARISCATYLATRAEILLRQGRGSEAADCLAQAWDLSQSIGEHYYQAELLRLQGVCAWQSRQAQVAERRLEQGLSLAEQQGKAGLALRCALSLGALQAAGGAFANACDTLTPRVQALAFHQSCRDWRWARLALQHWSRHAVWDHPAATPWEPT